MQRLEVSIWVVRRQTVKKHVINIVSTGTASCRVNSFIGVEGQNERPVHKLLVSDSTPAILNFRIKHLISISVVQVTNYSVLRNW